jgi:hypothetical protein
MKKHFGVDQVPEIKAKDCVTEMQCRASEMCIDGACKDYMSAQIAIKVKQAKH